MAGHHDATGISKGQRWTANPHLDVKLFDKSTTGSKHLYVTVIPKSTSNHWHAKTTLTGFIYGEARRIICLSSSQQGALYASRKFVARLQARAYPGHVIIKQLQKADYTGNSESRRDYIFGILAPKASSTNTNQPNPTNSTGGGNNATITSNNTTGNARTARVTCVLPDSKFSQDLQLQRVASAALLLLLVLVERYNNHRTTRLGTAWYNI